MPQNAEETKKLKSCEKKEQDPILVELFYFIN